VGEVGGRDIANAEDVERELIRLAGLLEGIALDGRILPVEVVELREWCAARRKSAAASAFREVVAKVDAAIEDGVLDEDERADLVWMCGRARATNPYWTVARTDLETLRGVLAGIGADRRVTERELKLLRTLLVSCAHLKGSWPYDEIESVIRSVLADGRIDDGEHRFLVEFTRSFLGGRPGVARGPVVNEDLIRHGAYAAAPHVQLLGRRFCVTGTSPAKDRARLERVVADLGGEHVRELAAGVDYLVVDAPRDVAWTFSCHGRKIEQALALRQEGARLTIVHADDFWAAAAERGVRRPDA
jgi:hypothetical protein